MTVIQMFLSTLLIVSYGLTLFHPVGATLDSGSCAFPNGQQATGYVVCNPTASQSSCCLEGEACLQDGLCYGAIGFMYRGACAGFVLDPLTSKIAANIFHQWLGKFHRVPGLLQHCRRFVVLLSQCRYLEEQQSGHVSEGCTIS
jgi:hypothetical protein